jgi:branched-chain amino acid aminotransferase
MSGLIYLNGILVDAQEAAIPVTDRAYLYGEGLFETMKATKGGIPFLPEHLDRFFSSFAVLDFEPNISKPELEHAVYQTLRQNHLQEAYLRIQLSRQNAAFGGLQAADRYHLLIVAQPLNHEMEEFRRKGMAAVQFSDSIVSSSPLNGVKSTNYAIKLRAKAYAKKQNAQEAVFADAQGHLVEGASSNLFIWNGHFWITPPLSSGALPGVMRRVLLSLMKAHGIPFKEQTIAPQDLAQAHEAILSNAIWEIMPLTRWEGQPIGTGQPSEKTHELQKWLADEIRSRISAES